MAIEQHMPSGGFPMANWVWLGLLTVGFYGVVGYLSLEALAAGVMTAGASTVLVLGALALWQRAQHRYPVPAAEYLALVWLLAYIVVLVANVAGERRVQIIDWIVLLPPLSILPIGSRWLLGDDGEPRGWARSAAYYLHMTIGVLLVGLALVFIISVLLAVVAPLPLVPGIMHLRAGYLYRHERDRDGRRLDSPADSLPGV